MMWAGKSLHPQRLVKFSGSRSDRKAEDSPKAYSWRPFSLIFYGMTHSEKYNINPLQRVREIFDQSRVLA
ncbi:MAG: hypothetical protein WBC75_07665, partial [Dehalococcoidales bacterium]